MASESENGGSYQPDAMAVGLSEHLRNLADKLESGRLCNGEVWERLYADGPEPVDYTAGPERNSGKPGTNSQTLDR